MTTLEIEIAVMTYLGIRTNLVVPNVSWGLSDEKYNTLHECDILSLTGKGYATEIEIKISKADLLKDYEKKHGHRHNLIKYLYYAVPSKLQDIALQTIPPRAGLYVVKNIVYNDGYQQIRAVMVRDAKRNTQAMAWTDKQRLQLARLGTMRILGLKKKVQSLKSSRL